MSKTAIVSSPASQAQFFQKFSHYFSGFPRKFESILWHLFVTTNAYFFS